MAAVDSVEELRLDAADLQSLVAASSRDANRARLEALLTDVRAQIAVHEAAASKAAEPAVSDAAADPAGAVADSQQDSESAEASTAPAPAAAPALPSGALFVPIHTFGWDQSDKFVSVYVSEHMSGVKASGAKVGCHFEKDSFDLTIDGLSGKSFRLTRSGLEKDIDPKKSKFRVKDDRVVLLLKKVPGEYGPDHWVDLVPKKKRLKASSADPTAGIMDMMKDMYDSGDDTMRKTIGEAMMKSQQGGGRGAAGDFGGGLGL